MTNITLGSDPEMMLFNRKSNKIVSAIPVIKHDKYNPINLNNGFTFYYDNVMLEATVPPAKSKTEFVNNFSSLFTKIRETLPKEFEPRAIASHIFSDKECEHDDAKVAGCNPEFCAYEVSTCQPPQFEGGFRSAGGHIHIGRNDFKTFYDEEGVLLEKAEGVCLIDPYSKLSVVKLMDLIVGSTLILIDQDSTSPARKKLYGKAGRHRPTDYGVEYRTPGNYWLRSPQLVELIYDLTLHAISIADQGETEEVLNNFKQEQITAMIDDNQKVVAKEIVNKLNLFSQFHSRINDCLRPQPESFYENWSILSDCS